MVKYPFMSNVESTLDDIVNSDMNCVDLHRGECLQWQCE